MVPRLPLQEQVALLTRLPLTHLTSAVPDPTGHCAALSLLVGGGHRAWEQKAHTYRGIRGLSTTGSSVKATELGLPRLQKPEFVHRRLAHSPGLSSPIRTHTRAYTLTHTQTRTRARTHTNPLKEILGRSDAPAGLIAEFPALQLAWCSPGSRLSGPPWHTVLDLSSLPADCPHCPSSYFLPRPVPDLTADFTGGPWVLDFEFSHQKNALFLSRRCTLSLGPYTRCWALCHDGPGATRLLPCGFGGSGDQRTG